MDGSYILIYKTGLKGRIAHWGSVRYTEPLPDEDGVVPVDFTPQEIIPENAEKVFLPAEEGERFIRLNGKRHIVRDGVIVFDETLPEYHGYFELENELAALREEMSANDYKQMKYMRGELTEEEFAEVKDWYTQKTAQYNEIEAEMKLVREEDAL